MLARIPYALQRADGSTVDGTRGVGLCAHCDHDDRDAQGVLAYFALHAAVTDDSAASLAALLDDWVQRLTARRAIEVDELDADKDYQRWLRGDL